MAKLPKEIKLTLHAQQRLKERSNSSIYNVKNLMRSSCKWYNKDDLIPQSQLYMHCLYVCRKSNQMGYLTDGVIEVIYNKGTGVAITIMEVKEKFLPITQYIKPEILKENERKKEIKKMRKKLEIKIGICPDCGREQELNSQGLCQRCRNTIYNAKSKHKEYIPYIKLSDEEKEKFDRRSIGNTHKKKRTTEDMSIDVPVAEVSQIENYYQVKAEQNPAIAVEKPIIPVNPNADIPTTLLKPLTDQDGFVQTLKSCGCDIAEDTLKEILDVLLATDKLKDIFMTVVKDSNQQAMLDLEQALNVVERKLQHNWEFNGFQEIDDIKFKGFLTWRRVLKGAIFFWKKLYQTNTLIEMQRAWNAYTQDPNEKILLAGDRINSTQKRFQITTESISTIFNTRRPFTRVFYATSKEKAYEDFVKWMADRQLHENKSKTTIVELGTEGE